jgi:hypothetical protein
MRVPIAGVGLLLLCLVGPADAGIFGHRGPKLPKGESLINRGQTQRRLFARHAGKGKYERYGWGSNAKQTLRSVHRPLGHSLIPR